MFDPNAWLRVTHDAPHFKGRMGVFFGMCGPDMGIVRILCIHRPRSHDQYKEYVCVAPDNVRYATDEEVTAHEHALNSRR